MQKNIKKIVLVVTSSLLLGGCGGGGGGGSSDTAPSSSPSATPTTKTTVSTPTSNTSYASSASATIVDASGVKGLKVVCNSKKVSTSQNGAFECTHFPIDIYLGSFKLGSVAQLPQNKIIYTQDIVGVARGATTNPTVTKISMLLQSLDNDANPSNGIELKQSSLDILNNYLPSNTTLGSVSFEDLTYMIEDTLRDIKTQDDASRLKLVDSTTAQYNLTAEVAKAPAVTSQQRSIGRIR